MLNIHRDWLLHYFKNFEPRYSHLRGKSIFMNCIATFSSNVGIKNDEYVTWELIYELWISYELYNEKTKSNELVGIYCAQWLMSSAKFPILDLIMDYEKWGVY